MADQSPHTWEDDKYTNDELIDLIDNEGLGYAVQHYLDADKIEDPKIAVLWQKACDALNAIEEALDIQY